MSWYGINRGPLLRPRVHGSQPVLGVKPIRNACAPQKNMHFNVIVNVHHDNCHWPTAKLLSVKLLQNSIQTIKKVSHHVLAKFLSFLQVQTAEVHHSLLSDIFTCSSGSCHLISRDKQPSRWIMHRAPAFYISPTHGPCGLLSAASNQATDMIQESSFAHRFVLCIAAKRQGLKGSNDSAVISLSVKNGNVLLKTHSCIQGVCNSMSHTFFQPFIWLWFDWTEGLLLNRYNAEEALMWSVFGPSCSALSCHDSNPGKHLEKLKLRVKESGPGLRGSLMVLSYPKQMGEH